MKISEILYENNLLEKFVNAVGNDETAMATKKKYMDQVWDLLQHSYRKIGGIAGKGFETKEAMLNIPMWKIVTQNGNVVACIMYKDKGGRKSVAMGSDGSDYARKNITNSLAAELGRAYGEKSKAALGLLLKTVPWDILQDFLQPPAAASKILGKEVTAIKDIPQEQWPEDAKFTIEKFPEIVNFGYVRELNGQLLFKVMSGTPGKNIT
jgi:hypothetical protein